MFNLKIFLKFNFWLQRYTCKTTNPIPTNTKIHRTVKHVHRKQIVKTCSTYTNNLPMVDGRFDIFSLSVLSGLLNVMGR